MTSPNSAWLLQAHPREWDVAKFLSDVRRGRTTPETTWLAPTHTTEIEQGDRAFLWMAGSETNAGVVALVTVTAPAADRPEDKPEYRMPGFEEKYGPPKTRICIRVDAILKFHLSRRSLKRIPGLEGLRVLRPRPQGTIFRVDPTEEALLEELCQPRLVEV